jgi:hypothetical protein
MNVRDPCSDHGLMVKVVASMLAVVIAVASIAPLGWAGVVVASAALLATTAGITHMVLAMMVAPVGRRRRRRGRRQTS